MKILNKYQYEDQLRQAVGDTIIKNSKLTHRPLRYIRKLLIKQFPEISIINNITSLDIYYKGEKLFLSPKRYIH